MTSANERNSNATTLPAGHEPDFVNARGVILSGTGLVLMVLIVLGLMAGLMAWFTRHGRLGDTPHARNAGEDISMQYAPLDVDQPRHRRELNASEQKRLFTYGWTDRQRQVARIPIDRAMALIAEKGLDAIPIVLPPQDKTMTPQETRPSTEAPSHPLGDKTP